LKKEDKKIEKKGEEKLSFFYAKKEV
jgi:hypothetical protein